MRKLPKIINREEFEQLLKAVPKVKRINPKTKKQYQLAMLLGFEAGMRISEIVGFNDVVPPLSPEQITEGSIKIVSGKGQKDRIVPRPKRLNEEAIKMLPLKIKRRALQHFIKMLGMKILNKEISFHTLRHGFGSHLAGNGMPLHMVQQLMGHSRLDTTGIYLHANPKEALEKAGELF